MSYLISHLNEHLVNHLIDFRANRVFIKEFVYLFRYLISLRTCRMYSTYVAYTALYLSCYHN